MTSEAAYTAADNTTDREIGERIHQLIWRSRKTQVAFAAELGITQGALSRKLRGDRPWYAAELIAVAGAFDTTVGALFGEAPSTTPPPTPPAVDEECPRLGSNQRPSA